MLMPIMFALLITGTTMSSPVQVETCKISMPTLVPRDGDQGGFDEIGDYALHVRFLNKSAEPISRVVFELSDGTTVVDVGKFSPNILIDHTLKLDATSATGCSLRL